MAGYAEPCRRVQRPGGDADRFVSRGVPEQARAALDAEASPCPRVASRTLDPTKPPFVEQDEILSCDSGGRGGMAVPAAALLAVANQDTTERAPYSVDNCAAQASTGRH